METRFLETFLAVVDNGSIAAAARRLNVTPAAVAQRLRALEEEMGFPLFIRCGRTVSVTEAGASIVGRVRDFVLQVRDLKTITAKKSLAGELRLGAISSAITGLLPGVLSRVVKKYPGLDVYVVPGTSAVLYQQVLAGELDAAIITQPYFDIPKTCEWQTLRKEPLVLLKPASVKATDVQALLSQHPFIRYDRRSWGGRLVDNYLRKIGARPQERFEIDALDAIAVLVDRGLGVALVPDWPPPWPAGLSLEKIPVAERSFDRHIGLVWARATPRQRLVGVFLQETRLEPQLPSVPRVSSVRDIASAATSAL